MKTSLCDGWEFTETWSEGFLAGKGEALSVRLPHTCKELPLHYIEPADYQMLCGYRRRLTLRSGDKGKRVFLQFDGAGHIATVYVNGAEAAVHKGGYTPFRVEVTGRVDWDRPNQIAVKLDTSEDPSIPPFGFVIDYLTYGGLYREVWLDVRGESYVDDLYVSTPTLAQARVAVHVDGPTQGKALRVKVLDSAGKPVWEKTAPAGEETVFTSTVPGARPWSTETPTLYTCQTSLLDGSGAEIDRAERTFGFRTAQFQADGFYLNGKKAFLRGLNRHQSYPYIGYAAPESLQREDARILREELGCNAVRTSHYPQSPWFLDECDRRGLLVFTELPGWQHIGDGAWKGQALEDLRGLILRDRSHPSVILWGVRINESLDDDEFYARTNALAHELDPSRATSGVRYLEKSHLLEDVYAFNDFSHDGTTPGAKKKKKVTPDQGKAFLISECNGHMYPTKPFDDWPHRQEQALRHVRVQNAALADGEHAGCFGWCMFDYPTHRDFGSGDRVCYHGVMDAFRNPKLAAAAYSSQGEGEPVLEIGSAMDIGDYPAGKIGDVYVFSNAEEVALYRNDQFVTLLKRSQYAALPHPPFLVDDTIGALLETQEGYSPKQARLIRDCLLAVAKGGLAHLSPTVLGKLLWCVIRYRMTMDDAVALYGKYVSGWGSQATRWRFEARVGGEPVKSVIRSPSAALHLEVRPSHTVLVEKQSYDLAAVRARVLDGNGGAAPYAQLPIRFQVSGPLEVVGPDTATAEGGMCGTFLRTVGIPGDAVLTVSAPGLERVTLPFQVKIQHDEVIV